MKGDRNMIKQVSFTDKDKILVSEIKAFQDSQGLATFIDAVRILCKNGLRMSDVVKNLK